MKPLLGCIIYCFTRKYALKLARGHLMVLCSFPLSQQDFKQGICINFSYVFGHLSLPKENQAFKISDGYDKYLQIAGLENRTSAYYRTLASKGHHPAHLCQAPQECSTYRGCAVGREGPSVCLTYSTCLKKNTTFRLMCFKS